MSWLNGLSFVGFFALCGIAWLTSENRRVIPWRTILWGLGLQLVLGLLVFLVPVTRLLLVLVSDVVNSVLDATEAGSRFIFGSLLVPDLATPPPGPVLAGRWIARAITPPYVPVPGDRLSPDNLSLGYVFAFRALPSVIFFSALMALLYCLGLIQPVVNLFGKLFRRTMGLSGAEALSGAANIFVGIESLLVVRPYLARMTRSELCAILACGFGSIASTALALYVGLLRPVFPNITGHLVSASLMAIPACFVMAKILVPETDVPETMGLSLKEQAIAQASIAPPIAPPSTADPLDPLPHDPEASSQAKAEVDAEPSAAPPDFAHKSASLPATYDQPELLPDRQLDDPELNRDPMHPMAVPVLAASSDAISLSPMESIVVGALDGAKLAVAIAALLIAILGLVALVNLFFANLGSLANSSQPGVQTVGRVFQAITLQNIVGVLFVPLTFLTGVPLNELWPASLLIGQRLILTEVFSYQQLATLFSQGAISNRTLLIVSYALCGFAHLPSIGIFVGGLIGLVPSRRKDITELGWKALWAATLATLMVGCIAGLYDTGNPGILGR
jgi:concentrative nucleoside transporter, CNT family